MHTARWDHDYDLTSKRVAVIGTGASAVQVVPEIAPLVAASCGCSSARRSGSVRDWIGRCARAHACRRAVRP